MSNKFTYSTYTFQDDAIVTAEISTEQSLLSEHLTADVLTLLVRYTGSGDLTTYNYGTPIIYYKDNTLYGKFYVTQVIRTGMHYYQFTAVSAVGMMAYMVHKGGVYVAQSVGGLIDDIMSGTGFTYTVATAVRNTVVSGYLPYSNKMANLQQVLFAIGASLLKDASGNLNFVFNVPSTAKNIPDSRVYMNSGENVIVAPATSITLTEHLYYQNPYSTAEEIYSYSGSPVTNQTIILDEPVVPSSVTGDASITNLQAYATYITFSGNGTIYGIKYTHIKTEKQWNAPVVNGEENTVSVNNATLVTAANSANVMTRLVKYYTQQKQSNLDFVASDEKTGDYVTFNDRFGDPKDGFVSKIKLSLSKGIKADAEVVTNWYPTDTGNNFNAYQLIQATGTVTVPTAARGKAGRLVLIGGFRGGQGGTAGQDGTGSGDWVTEQYGQRRSPGQGGEHGGKGGAGGTGVMVYSVDIASLPSSFSVTAIGAGGAGGAAGVYNGTGTLGSLGGNTTVTINNTSYSSASGTENVSGFINFIDGTFYNFPGASGYDNDTGTGGRGCEGNWTNPDPAGEVTGGSFTTEGTTWNGGSRGAYYTGSAYSSGSPGGGGGAAYGQNGTAGGGGSSSRACGKGGNGATPNAPAQAVFPYCGQGGHGGGAGGGAGGAFSVNSAPYFPNAGAGGTGGAGSVGGQGANGAVIFYYGT